MAAARLIVCIAVLCTAGSLGATAAATYHLNGSDPARSTRVGAGSSVAVMRMGFEQDPTDPAVTASYGLVLRNRSFAKDALNVTIRVKALDALGRTAADD